MKMSLFFATALDLKKHPMKKADRKIKKEYFMALTYVIYSVINETEYFDNEDIRYIAEKINMYRRQVFENINTESKRDDRGYQAILAINLWKRYEDRNDKELGYQILLAIKSWKNQYRQMLLCDAALCLMDKMLIYHVAEIIKNIEVELPKNQRDANQIFLLLYSKGNIDKKYIQISPLIMQFRKNREFALKKEYRIIVTANMSAGKSTLINALIGKRITRTSQEVCTGNVCYLFNKAYEDGNISLKTSKLNLMANTEDLCTYDWNGKIEIASFFKRIESKTPRLCMIDTPGVDAALYKEHSKMTHQALLHDNYDLVLYVISPTNLGTDAEKKHLQWVASNLLNTKIVFVLNKVDEYQAGSDSIEESIKKLKKELQGFGFEKPVICPISAYGSYLLKLKMTGRLLTEDEQEEYTVYFRKFKRPAYDLSKYSAGVQILRSDSEEIKMSKRIGLYGLEKIIYGGRR